MFSCFEAPLKDKAVGKGALHCRSAGFRAEVANFGAEVGDFINKVGIFVNEIGECLNKVGGFVNGVSNFVNKSGIVWFLKDFDYRFLSTFVLPEKQFSFYFLKQSFLLCHKTHRGVS